MKYPILLPNIFNHAFTYESDLKLMIGDYVVVPFGKSNEGLPLGGQLLSKHFNEQEILDVGFFLEKNDE